MRSFPVVSASIAVAAVLLAVPVRAEPPISAAETRAALRKIREEPAISRTLSQIARQALSKFADLGLEEDGLGIAVVVDSEKPVMGGYRLDSGFYPASVVKIAYAIALEKDFAEGSLPRDAATLRDLDLMLTESSNAATNRILDRLTDTQSGEELDEAALAEFAEKRNAVNRYLRTLGFTETNANQKTWDDRPFGRDVQFLGASYENRNRMTPRETAEMVWLIKNEHVVSREGAREIQRYMRRKPGDPEDIQARRIGAGIPPTAGLWSKAGWTSNTNHDAAYVDLPFGDSFVLVVFTNTGWKAGEIQEWIARQVTSAVQLGTLRPEFIKAPVVVPGRGSK